MSENKRILMRVFGKIKVTDDVPVAVDVP